MANPTKEEIKQAEEYVADKGHLKRGSKEARERLDNGDDSHSKLWSHHKADLQSAKETLKKAGVAEPKPKVKVKAAPINRADFKSHGAYADAVYARSTEEKVKRFTPEHKAAYDSLVKSGKTGWQTVSANGTSHMLFVSGAKEGDSINTGPWVEHHKEEAAKAKSKAEKQRNKTQKTDAQTKTARFSRKGKEAQGGNGRSGVAKIAKSMKDSGKTGWVTINGAKINLG